MLRPWKISLSDRIDAKRDIPIYLQIIQALVRDIERGRLPKGTFLPSTRELASAIGVNRKTVVLAYEDLIAQGWLSSAGTRGTMVSTELPELDHRIDTPKPIEQITTADYRYATPPKRPLALPDGDGYKLDEGTPDGRLFPVELLSRAYRSAVQRASRNNGFQYRDPRGHPALREAVATMLMSERGLSVTAQNICITRGSQNGIFLATQALIKPGDAVIFEELTYEPAVAAFKACGAEIVPVGIDEGGVNLADVELACRRHPVRAIFLTPHHQFPTTVALRPERRLRLLELARQFGFAIVEDDYDHEFHFESQPLLPMAGYAPNHVIYVGSLSKLLLPALRIGYIAAPAAVIDAISHFVSLTDGMGNSLSEDAAAELIANGELRRHARKVRQIYLKRRDAFAQTLMDTLGDKIDYAIPDGGLAFWLKFHEIADLDLIESRAPDLGLRFALSSSFMAAPHAERGLRFGFASLTPHEARQALGMLQSIIAGT